MRPGILNITGFLTILLFLIGGLTGCGQEEKPLLAFFYREHCPGCDTYKRAEEIAGFMKDYKSGYEVKTVNLLTEENFRDLKGVIEEQGLPDVSRSLPLLIHDDKYVNGYDEIERYLKDLLGS